MALVAQRPPGSKAAFDGGRSRSKGSKGSAVDVFASLAGLEMAQRQQEAVTNQDKSNRRLEAILGKPLKPSHCGLKALRGRSVPALDSGSPNSAMSTGTAGGRAPKYVGKGANELAKAMSVDRVTRFRDERTRNQPTTRQMLTLDDSIDTSMLCRTQEGFHTTYRITLAVPLDCPSPEAARARVLGQLAEDFHEDVGRCASYVDGRVIEITVQEGSSSEAIYKSLQRLGEVSRRGNINPAALLIAMHFSDVRAGSKHDEPRARPSGTSATAGTRPLGVRFVGLPEALSRQGSPDHGTPLPRDGADWAQPEDLSSLRNAMAKWDARLRREAFFSEAAAQVEPWTESPNTKTGSLALDQSGNDWPFTQSADTGNW